MAEITNEDIKTEADLVSAPLISETQSNLMEGKLPAIEGPAQDIQVEPTAPLISETQKSLVDGVVPSIETPQVTETVVTPEVKVPKIDTPKINKVETVQDIETKTIQNESADIKLQEDKRNKTIAEATALVQNGASMDDLIKFGANNPDNLNAIGTTLKGAFKNASNLEFFGKYSTMSNDDMFSAYTLGEVTPGSERYNMLPPEKKASFDAFLKQKEAANITEKTDYTATNNATDMTELNSQVPKMFNSTVRENYKKALNTPKLLELNAKAANKQLELDTLDIEMETLQEDMEKQLAGNLTGSIRAEVRQSYNEKIREKRLKLAEYNSFASQISSIRSQAETELKLSQYEDGIARDEYKTALGLYESRRQESIARGEKIEDRDFELKTQEQAEERQKAFQIEMKELDQKLKNENKTGTYQTDRDGNLLYLVNGKAQKVKDSDGDVVGVNKTKDYSESIQKHTDGTFSVFRTYEDGRKPEMFNYGIDGKSANNTSMGVYDALGNIDAKGGKWFDGKPGLLQCGEAANRYMKAAGITDKRVGDSYASKKDLINNNTPQVGGLAIWNPNSEGKYGENGHIGMVTGYNPEQGVVEITDWNKNGDGAKNTYTIPVSQVINSDGGFGHLESEGEVVTQVQPLNDKQFTQLNQFTSRFAGNPVVKSFESALSSGGDLLASLKSESGPGDVAAVFGFMKTLDPTSVVRESEFALAENTAGISSKPGILWGKVKSGERLTNEQRKEFGRVAFEFVKNKGQLYDAKYDEFERIMTNQGISKEYFPTRFTDLITDVEEAQATIINEPSTTSLSGYENYKKTSAGSTQISQDILDIY